MNNIKDHENIYLHIKKSTFKRILNALWSIPFGIYLITSLWVGLENEIIFGSTFRWYDFGAMMSSFIFSLAIIVLLVLLLAGDHYD